MNLPRQIPDPFKSAYLSTALGLLATPALAAAGLIHPHTELADSDAGTVVSAGDERAELFTRYLAAIQAADHASAKELWRQQEELAVHLGGRWRISPAVLVQMG